GIKISFTFSNAFVSYWQSITKTALKRRAVQDERFILQHYLTQNYFSGFVITGCWGSYFSKTQFLELF
ncbi:hypothetical protein KTT66_12005, partial [Lacticaseibacillus casei]|uniref:hypothetical protein n=1 Tax=Lacticaseibacillus casei TaxID=1582 RepID=UPI001C382623